jgi:hypothetical protein
MNLLQHEILSVFFHKIGVHKNISVYAGEEQKKKNECSEYFFCDILAQKTA